MAAINITYELPHDDIVERGVLGELLTTGRLSKVEDILTPETFYYELHRNIYRSMARLYAAGAMVTYSTVRTDMQASGVRFAEDELANIATADIFDVRGQSEYLNELALRRRIGEGALEVLGKVQRLDVDTDEVLAAAARIQTSDDANERKDADLADMMDEAEAIIKANREGAGAAGTMTGFAFIDDRGGLRPGTLTVIGGATSNGKTSFAMALAKGAVQRGEHVGLFSLEMPPVELGQRLIATESNVENYKIAAKPLSGHDLTSVTDAIDRIKGWDGNLHVDRRKVAGIGAIQESAGRMVRRYGCKGIVVDFLQIIDLGKTRRGETEEAQIAEITRRLKLFALQQGVWVIALSQLNREGSAEEPDINRMRGSGRIGENADNVMLVYRPEAYPDGSGKYKGRFEGLEHGTAEIIMPKGRNTGVGKYLVAFDARTTAFTPITDIANYLP